MNPNPLHLGALVFSLADSGFARGIKDWLAAQPDQPLPDAD